MIHTKKEKEGKGIYTFAHPFPAITPLAHYVGLIAKECKKKGVIGNPSKMGVHLTLLPPFYANHETIRFAATCVIAATIMAEKWSSSIKVSGVGYSPPPTDDSDVEALYLAVVLSKRYEEYISRLKASSPFVWVHPPAQTSAVEPIYIPHVHVIEGVNIIKRTKRLKEEFNNIVAGRTFDLQPPVFFKKTEGEIIQWRAVHF